MITVVGRKLVIPEKDSQIGTTYDNNSEVRHIRLNRITAGGVDLTNLRYRLDLEYEDAILDTCLLDAETQEAYILLTWRIPAACVSHKGTVWIAVRAYDENGTIKWATNPGAVYVGHTIFDGEAYKGHLAEFEQLEERITQKAETLDANESKRQEAEEQRKANEERRVNNEAEWQRQAETAIAKANTTLEKATEKAEEATQAAATATVKAEAAEASSEAANQSANTASQAANTAATRATEAERSATAASRSESTASQAASTATAKAEAAEASSTAANQSANTASQAANTATTRATEAERSATAANQSANTASQAAGTATNKATEAERSAEEAKRYSEQAAETVGFDGTASTVSAIDTQGININTASGTTQVTVDDAWEAPIPGLEIAGKSEQGADPSPDNPQEIVSADVTAVTVTGAQVIPYPYHNTTKTSNGITFTDMGNGGIKVTGTCTKQYTTFEIHNNLFLPPGIYTKNVSEEFGLVFQINRYINNEYDITVVGPNDKTFDTSSWDYNKYKYHVLLQVTKPDLIFNTIFYPMINRGDTALPWEPYRSKTAAIALAEPLRGIGDVRDRIMCKDGVWGVERAINQIDDTGTVPISKALQVLDVPTWEPLPSDTQAALNALTAYKGRTTITVTADGPEPDITMQYYGQPGAKTNAQNMLDSLARKVAQELVSNASLAQLLSGYIAKSSINNTGLVTEAGFVADARQMNPNVAGSLAAKVKKNTDDIVTANSNLAKNNAKVTLNGVKNINGFTAVYSDRTDRAFQLYYENGEIASIAFNNTGIWYDFYDGQKWKQVWKFNKPT